jgi:hypothetical protein
VRAKSRGVRKSACRTGLYFVFRWRCLRCGCKLKEKNKSLDHIVPSSKGGANFLENLQPMCKKCNSEKKTDSTVDYRPKQLRSREQLLDRMLELNIITKKEYKGAMKGDQP